MLKKLVTFAILLSLLGTYFSLPTSSPKAVSGFSHLIAQINSNTLLGATEMTVRFILPQNSPPIRKSDYIQIYLADFSSITAPTQIHGDYAGLPIYSASGQYARVSGVRVMPSGFVEISGITLTNPGDEDLFQVVVMVTEDEAATQVKNISNVRATLNYGSVTVRASIPAELASLVISGYTGPDTFLIFSESNTVMGTDVANALGQFSTYFSGLQPTTHNISFYGVDDESRSTTPVPISIYTPAFQQTSISNQLLSPTIEIDAGEYLIGDDIIASGSALPSGDITVLTDNPLRSYVSSASAQGDWTYTITNTDEYVPGDYRIYSIVQNGVGLQSLTSPSVFFSLRTTDSAGTACGDISQGDLNCDFNVDLTDFSILMFYWGTTNAAADINNDGTVDLTDFSILMYYWGN